MVSPSATEITLPVMVLDNAGEENSDNRSNRKNGNRRDGNRKNFLIMCVGLYIFLTLFE